MRKLPALGALALAAGVLSPSVAADAQPYPRDGEPVPIPHARPHGLPPVPIPHARPHGLPPVPIPHMHPHGPKPVPMPRAAEPDVPHLRLPSR